MRVMGFTALSSVVEPESSGCRCGANRFLPCPESSADLLLGVVEELVGPTQGVSAAVQDLSGLLLYGPNALCRPCAHPARPILHVLLHIPSPQPHGSCPHDGPQDETLADQHRALLY